MYEANNLCQQGTFNINLKITSWGSIEIFQLHLCARWLKSWFSTIYTSVRNPNDSPKLFPMQKRVLTAEYNQLMLFDESESFNFHDWILRVCAKNLLLSSHLQFAFCLPLSSYDLLLQMVVKYICPFLFWENSDKDQSWIIQMYSNRLFANNRDITTFRFVKFCWITKVAISFSAKT